MILLELPVELVGGIFQQIFLEGWMSALDWDKALGLRIVCKSFNHLFKQYALGHLRLHSEPDVSRALGRMTDALLVVLMQQKARNPQTADCLLISKICDTVGLASLQSGNEVASKARRGDDVDVLCVAAMANLGRKKAVDLLTMSRTSHVPSWLQGQQDGFALLSPAAAIGNIPLMRDLLKNGADINTYNCLCGKPLHAAAAAGQEAAVKLLIKEGVNIEVTKNTRFSISALCFAAALGHDAVVRVLLKHGARAILDSKVKQPLHYAMTHGGYETIIIALLQNGAEVNSRSINGETALHHAATIGIRNTVLELLVEQGADIEAKNEDGETPIFVAAKKNRKDMVDSLLAIGAEIRAKDTMGRTMLHRLIIDKADRSRVDQVVRNEVPIDAVDGTGEIALLLAIGSRQFETAKLILENGANINKAGRDSTTPLHKAIQSHDANEPMVRLLLKHGANVVARTFGGEEPLHMSAEKNYEVITRLLLDSGASVNTATRNGRTALHLASSQGNGRLVQLLLQRGADVRAQTAEGFTSLHFAAMNNKEAVAYMLLQYGADVRAHTVQDPRKGVTPLHLAAPHGDLAEHLVMNDANLEAKDANGRTALFYAAMARESIVTVPRLLKLGADINTSDNDGDTLLHLAAGCGNSAVTAMLVEQGINVDEKNSAGKTALHLAARGHNEVIQILLDHGAAVDARDGMGKTALQVAASWSNGHEASLQLLIRRGAKLEIEDNSGMSALKLFRRSKRDGATIEKIIARLLALERVSDRAGQ